MAHLLNHIPGYRIKAVASTTGLSAHVIRKWEERYHVLHPRRSRNSYRIYTEEDIQLLLYIKEQLAQGESIGQLSQVGEPNLKRFMQQTPVDLSTIPVDYRKHTMALIQAARIQDLPVIQTIVTGWIDRLGLEGALEIILFPLLRIIGDLWHQGGISITGEHSVTGCIRRHLLNALGKDGHLGQAQALIACLPGEYHEVPALAAAFLLQRRGWRVTYLGPNVPFDILHTALRRNHADLMILSCMTEPERKLGQRWIHTLAQRFQSSCRVMVGGPGFSGYTEVLARYGLIHLKQMQDVMNLHPKSWVSPYTASVRTYNRPTA